MKKTVILGMVLALLASSAWAQFDGRGWGQGDRPMPQGQRQQGFGPHHGQGFHQGQEFGGALLFADEIGLTDAQRDKIETLMIEHRLAMVDIKAEARKAQIKVKAIMRDVDAPESDVMRAIDGAARAKSEIAKAKYAHRKQCREILTPEQQDKLDELRLERRKMRFEDRPGKDSPRGRRSGR